MLLEEALLFLLKHSGYDTVEIAGTDPTLCEGHSGMEVIGRGEKHQIDAIADYKASPPFSNPQRLLVEGKFYTSNNPVGLTVIRNAVGVLKDINEFFYSSDLINNPSKIRYHYTYGIFSASGYRQSAERYAFAHDIYLIPVAHSQFFKPVIDSIRDINEQDLILNERNNLKIKDLRQDIRNYLNRQMEFRNNANESNIFFRNKIEKFLEECKKIRFAVIAIAGKSFPILLIPNPNIQREVIESDSNIRINWDKESWYIIRNQQKLYSFDLPEEFFKLYAEQGVLTQSAALDLKQTHLSEFRILSEVGNEFKITSLKLDDNWINLIRENLNTEHGADPESQFGENDIE